MNPRFASCVLSSVFLFASACAPKSRFDQQVNTASNVEFQSWYGSAYAGASPLEKTELDEVLMELKKQQARKPGSHSSEATFDGIRELLAGKTLRGMLIAGLEAKKERLELDRGDVLFLIKSDEKLHAKAGDVEAATALEGIRKDRADSVARLEKQLAEVAARLAELQAPAKS